MDQIIIILFLSRVLILHLKRFCPFTLTKSMAPLQLEAELQIKQRW